MASEQASPAARYQSLRDYLRVLRRYWIMIALVAIVGAAAGFASVARQKPVYQSSAEVNFEDPNQALSLIGSGSGTAKTPGAIATVNADTLTAPAVMGPVKRELRSSLSIQALAGAISTQVDPDAGMLQISATGPSPAAATRLANTVAGVLVSQDNQQTRATFLQVAGELRRQISQLPRSPIDGSAYGPLSYYENELAKMKTLGGVATSAQLLKPAQPPAGPSSPGRSRSVLLGLALGLLLGVIVAFIRDAMDRRLRRPQDVESSFRLPVLGQVGKRSMGRVVSGSGGSGNGVDLDLFRILRRNLELLDHRNPPRSILVTSAAPEEGKTTVASSLAFALASAGKRTLLVDCDLRRPALAGRLGVEPSPGLSEYLAGAATPEEILRTVVFSEPGGPNGARARWLTGRRSNGQGANGHGAANGPRLVCIPSGNPTSNAAELLGSPRFREFIEQVSETYDAVVLDSSPLLAVADTLEMLPHLDAVVICARESRTTRDQAQAARAALSRFPERPAGVVVTGVTPRSEMYAYSYSYS